MLVLSRQAGRATTSRAGTAGGGGESSPAAGRRAMTWWLLLSSSDLLCRGAGPDGRDWRLQSEGERW